jgi:pilus retraction protein PilT
MENFKKALKQAIMEKAEGVRFEEGQTPTLLFFSNERSLSNLQGMDQYTLEQLIISLLPSSTSPSSSLREGSLSIVNFGELKLLADLQTPIRLFTFIPPQGNQLFQQIKGQLLQPQSRSAPPKPIDLPSSHIADFEPTLRPGHFAISNVTGQTSTNGTSTHSKIEEPTIHAPPIMKREDDPFVPEEPHGLTESNNTLVRPRMPLPVSTASAEGESDFGLKAKSIPTSVAPPIPNLNSPSEEDADTEDYHFNQSVHSIARLPASEFTNTYASSSLPASSPAKTEHVETAIHFGSVVPGETIERLGQLPIDSLLGDMVQRKASDLHMTMGEPPCMRIDGEIQRHPSSRITEEQMRSYLMPIMPPKNREEFARTHDTDFAYEVPGLARFRVNVFRDRQGVGAVLRQIPDRVLSADDLGLPAAIRKLCELHKGLVVVTGPTGSGKSTTLAAMIDLINETRHDHILTIEDPIEFVHRQKNCLINQREVHKHTTSFSRALRAALREDPDIVLIGEMRDLETIEIAIETAETGHLVFGTLHTNTAISTVDRLIDQFPPEQQEQVRVMLSESLKGVVAQTLVKKKGGGRVAAQEILIVDKAVSGLIREGNTHMVQNHMQTQKAKGNLQLNEALLMLVTRGLVDPKDAYMKAVEKEAFLSLLQQKGITLELAKNAS